MDFGTKVEIVYRFLKLGNAIKIKDNYIVDCMKDFNATHVVKAAEMLSDEEVTQMAADVAVSNIKHDKWVRELKGKKEWFNG